MSKTPCTCKDCEAAAERLQKHLNNPFYKKVKENVDKFAMDQILKGAETYPEPFNPDSWTEEQLYEHAMQELADAQNYNTGMLDRMIKQRELIEQMEAKLTEAGKKIMELTDRVADLEIENKTLKGEF